MIALRDQFVVPPDGERFQVVHDDGAQFVAAARQRYDVLLVDGFCYDGQPEALGTPAFYDACRAVLAPRGVMVVNLHAEAPDCAELLLRMVCAFDGQVHAVHTEDGGNRVVFAGRASDFWPGAADFSRRWLALAEVHRRTLRKCAGRIARGLNWSAAQADAQGSASAAAA